MTTLQAAFVIAFAIVGGVLATIENSKSHFQSSLCWGVMSLAASVIVVAIVLVAD